MCKGKYVNQEETVRGTMKLAKRKIQSDLIRRFNPEIYHQVLMFGDESKRSEEQKTSQTNRITKYTLSKVHSAEFV